MLRIAPSEADHIDMYIGGETRFLLDFLRAPDSRTTSWAIGEGNGPAPP